MNNILGRSLVFLTAVCLSTVVAFAQNGEVTEDSLMNRSNIKGPLQFTGNVIELSKKLKGAIVTLYESPDGSHDNLTEVMRTVTPGSGVVEFKLEVNKFFVLSVEKSGYTTKKVDIDTDVTMAREQYTSVPKFEFQVDMVKDLDGLPFVGSVASVFYQIKRNEFDYQLDYSKEEMEDEERELREKREKERLAQLAYEKKKELEEAAKLMLNKENATAQEIIKAAITIGDGDKEKTVKGFLDVFSEVDTLREKKANVMFAQLQEERKLVKATGGDINFQSIFDSANAFENEVVAKAEEEREKKLTVLRAEQEEAERKSKEAMAIQQKAIEVEAKEKLATAIQAEEIRKAKEQKEKSDKVYYAIFDANGDAQLAIQNLVKTYPKSDPYKEEKAKAIYAEYEKTRLTGTTLSKMDFNKLFSAADVAEQKAISENISKDRERSTAALDEFKVRVEERKRKEQEETVNKIESGLKEASADRASQIAVFKEALPKNESYKDEKAEAMYEEYLQQKKIVKKIEENLKTASPDAESQYEVFYNALPEGTPDREATAQRMYDNFVASKQAQGGKGTVAMDFGSLFKVAEVAEENLQQAAKEKNAIEKQKAQDQLEAQREEIRKEKSRLATMAEKQVEEVHRAGMANAKNKNEKALAEAIEKGAGDRDKTVENIRKVLPQTDDKGLDLEKAEAVFDAYLKESRTIKESGQLGTKVDFATLFAAADQAELDRLQRQFEEKQAADEVKLAKYQETRTEKAIEIAQAQQKRAEQEALQAETEYEKTLHRTEIARQERLAAEQKEKEDLAKQQAMELAQREVEEKERANGELAVVERERLKRLEREQQEADRLAAAEDERKRKEAEIAANQAREQLALLEKQKREAELAKQKEQKALELAEAKKAAEERSRLEAAEKARQEAELAASKAEEARLREAQRLAEEADKARIAEQLAEAKAAEDARKAEEKRLADAEKALITKQQADAKAEEDRLKEEQRLADEAEKARIAEQLAQAKAAEAARKAEEKRLADAEKARIEQEIADAKAAEEARIAEEKRLEELAKKNQEEAERQRQAAYDKLVSDGDIAIAKKDYQKGWENYKSALALYPDNKDANKKFAETEIELKRIEKEQAEQLALDQKYNALLIEAQQELAAENYESAESKFTKASELKPTEQEPKQQLRNIKRALDEIAADKKAKQDAERKYVLAMQEGAKALQANKLDEARARYTEAESLKPESGDPLAKLQEISDLEEKAALAVAETERRKEEARKEFEKSEELKRQQAQAEIARKEKERAERIAALGVVNDAKEMQQLGAAQQEQARIDAFEKLQESLKEMDLSADEQRQAFLSELSKIYPEGLTKETVNGKNFILLRHVINQNNVVTIYEKKTWDWGGVFYFKDSDIAITEAIYKLEIGKY